MAGKRPSSRKASSGKRTKLEKTPKEKPKVEPSGTASGAVGPSGNCEAKNFHQLQSKLRQKMPDDFFHVWEWCERLKPSSPSDALQDSLGLLLVGPYNILDGSVTAADERLHSRHFYDPPEFTTVLAAAFPEDGFHVGYYRDLPSALPSLVATNDVMDGCKFDVVGDNLVCAIMNILLRKRAEDTVIRSPLASLESDLAAMASHHHYSLDKQPPAIKKRQQSIVTKTFHGLGFVVPVDESEVGYRPLPVSDVQLRKILGRIADAKSEEQRKCHFEALQDILTLVQFANDECDYGMGLELGMDLFLFGSDVLHKTARRLLVLAYDLLEREELGETLEAHLANRKKPYITCK